MGPRSRPPVRGDYLRMSIKRFGVVGALSLLGASLSSCADRPQEASIPSDEPINLTAQTGTYQFANASFAVQSRKDGSGVLIIKGKDKQVLELNGASQFSVMPVALEESGAHRHYFIATSSVVDNRTRHIGWVVRSANSGWIAYKLPFASEHPIRPPVDVNGDGRREFVLVDTSFPAVAFGGETLGGPESYFIVKDEGILEQTAHSQYALHRNQKRELARTACEDLQTIEACGIYAAWSAQVGKLEEAWSLVLQLADQKPIQVCRIDGAIQPCATGAGGVDLTAPELIQFKLAQSGYIPPAWLNLPGEDDTSFGCAHASTVAERTICSEPSLRALERREAAEASRRLAYAHDRSEVFDERMSYIARRDRTMGVLALTELYQERLAEKVAP